MGQNKPQGHIQHPQGLGEGRPTTGLGRRSWDVGDVDGGGGSHTHTLVVPQGCPCHPVSANDTHAHTRRSIHQPILLASLKGASRVHPFVALSLRPWLSQHGPLPGCLQQPPSLVFLPRSRLRVPVRTG